MKYKIQKTHEDAIIPKYAHAGDSGMDVYAVEDIVIGKHSRGLVPIGLKFSIPAGEEIQIRSKSGLALKYGITVLNSPGTIDSNYRGEVGVILSNMTDFDFEIKKKTKIAQIVVCPVIVVDQWFEVDDISDDSTRGVGGFGSTGLN